jgi:glycosyltransferase involved in cell wall biosynthesis
MVFTNENCGLLSTLDPVDLAAKIDEGLTEEKVRGNECNLKAGEYNWEKIITAVENYYTEINKVEF